MKQDSTIKKDVPVTLPIPPVVQVRTLLQRLDALDMRLSRPIFLANLPAVAEYALSVPGNFFGVPVVTLLVMPNALAIYFSESHPLSTWWHCVVWLLIMAVLILWNVVLTGNKRAIRIFYGPTVGALAALVGVSLLSWMPDELSSVRQIGYFQLAAWCLAVIPVAVLKPSVARLRPVMCHKDTDDYGKMMKASAESKHLSILPRLFRKDGRASFPSGDAAGAMAVAFVIGRCDPNHSQLPSILIVLLSAAGRMYWQAHYLGDVVVGATLSWTCCWLLEQVLLLTGSEPCRAQRWHAMLAHGALCTTVILSRLYYKTKVFQSGTLHTEEVCKKL